MTGYSAKLGNQTFVRGYGSLSFAKDIDKDLSGKYSENHFYHAKNYAAVAPNLPHKGNSKNWCVFWVNWQ